MAKRDIDRAVEAQHEPLEVVDSVIPSDLEAMQARISQLEAYIASQHPAAQAGDNREVLREILQEVRTRIPENLAPPLISAYSTPRGERDDAKTKLPFELYWFGYPVHRYQNTETWYELDMLAQLQPGAYVITKRDFSTARVTVKATYGETENVIKALKVEGTLTRDDKTLFPEKYVAAYQMVHPSADPMESYAKGTQQLLQLRVEDKQAKAGKRVGEPVAV